MHQIKTEYLEALLQYLVRKPYNEVHQLIAMCSSAIKVEPKPEPAQQAGHEVLEEQSLEEQEACH